MATSQAEFVVWQQELCGRQGVGLWSGPVPHTMPAPILFPSNPLSLARSPGLPGLQHVLEHCRSGGARRILRKSTIVRPGLKQALPMKGSCLWGDRWGRFSRRPEIKAFPTWDRIYVWVSTR